MNKFILLLILVLSFPVQENLLGQILIPEINIGVGKYHMYDLKDLQDEIATGYPVDARVVDDFPAYFNFKGSLLYEINRFGMGFSWSRYSTGARLHYKDYSGEISLKQIIKTDFLGLPFNYILNKSNPLNFCFRLEPGLTITKLSILEEVSLYSQSSNNQYKFTSNSLGILVGTTVNYKTGRWQPGISFGYFIDTKGKLYLDGDKNKQLVQNDNTSIKSDFSGLRIGISLSYQLIIGNPTASQSE
jgi:hypothetical protein